MLDEKFTKAIQAWLMQEQEQRSLEEGALLLLRINRNQRLYSNIIRRRDFQKLENELNKSIQLGRNRGSNIIFIKNGKFYTGTGHYYLNYKGSTSNVVGKINLMNPFGALYPNLNVDGVNYDGLLTITVVGENLELESDYSISGNMMITEYANYSFYSDDMNLYIDQDFLGITITYIYID